MRDPTKARASAAAWRKTNREHVLEYNKQWAAANPDKVKARADRYRKKNAKKIKARRKAYRQSKRCHEYNVEYTNVYYARPVNRMRLLAGGAILRAKKRGLEFDSSLPTFLMANPATHCLCCGRELDYTMRRGERAASPSLDRFDNSRGYTISNTKVVCMRCNDVKGYATLSELESVVRYMRDHNAGQNILALGMSAAGLRPSKRVQEFGI